VAALVTLATTTRAASIHAPIEKDAVESGPSQALGATPCVGGFAGIYPCNKVDLMAYLPINTIGGGSGSDIWGWTDPVTGHEWAIVGRSNGTAFVDVTDPANPVYVANLQNHTFPATSSWREIKTYGNHVYIVADNNGAHGLQIFDLTRLRDVVTPPVTFTAAQADGHYGGFGRCHDVAVDTESGFLYCVGTDTFNGGLHILDLSNPTNPSFAGSFFQYPPPPATPVSYNYIHDTQCVVYHGPDVAHQGKQLCFAANSTTSGGSGLDRLLILDVTNKSAPVPLSATTYPGSGFIHQGWLTEDHRYFLVDDELDETNFGHNTKTYMWDLLDLEAPVFLGFHSGPTTAIDHNQFVKGNYSYQANYTAGLRIIDLTNLPSASLAEAAFFDIVPAHNNPTFNGAWGVYPFFASGTVIVSGISGTNTGGLFVLRPTLGADFSLAASPGIVGVCGTGAATSTVSVTPANGYTGTVTFGTSGLPAGASSGFVPASTAVPGSSTLTVTANGVAAGTHPFAITATDGTITRQTSATLSVATTTPAAPALVSPPAGVANQPTRPSFTWSPVAGATSYDLQIAATPTFQPTAIVQSATGLLTTTHTAASELASNTTYYWRVRTNSACGTGSYSAPRSFTTTAPLAGCPLGTSAQAAFTESFETGAPGWNHNGTGDTWAPSSARVHEGAFSFHAAGSASVSDQRLTSPPILLPPGDQTPVTLQFWNWQEIQDEVTLEAPQHVGCRDGAILEVSTDGSNWTRLETQLLTDPYDGLVSGGTANPLAGVAAWCGNPQDWLNSVADVTEWAGQNVRFRLRLGTDSADGREGWYVDELKVQGCVPNPTPSLAIGDVTADEADAHDAEAPDHSPLLTFAVTLSAASAQTVTVSWATANGTAVAGADYIAASGTLTFPPGATTQPIDVEMLPDLVPEPPETFFVNLSGPVSATLADAQGVATILDNDTTPALAIADASVQEGDAGTRSLVFTVTQSQPIAQTTTVGFVTVNGTASAPSDFVAASGGITFPGGTSTRTIAVAVNGDPTDEPDESFVLELLAPNGATVADGQATGTILDDDGAPGEELAHGTAAQRTLASLAGGVPRAGLFRMAQRDRASYEVVVDAATGGVSPVVLERLSPDQATVLQPGAATGTGSATALRWENRGATANDQWIRVRSGGCTSTCGAGEGYRVRAYETTLSLPRFVASGGQTTVVILHNPTARAVAGHVDFWDAGGAPLGAHAFTLDPRASAVVDASSVAGVAGASGSASITHDAGYGELRAKAIALEPATGFAFDTPAVLRVR
jgi:choice-of-anchor B domain-containing protein